MSNQTPLFPGFPVKSFGEKKEVLIERAITRWVNAGGPSMDLGVARVRMAESIAVHVALEDAEEGDDPELIGAVAEALEKVLLLHGKSGS